MRSFWMWIVIVLTLIPTVADATAVSVTIYGTNKSNAQTNVTCYGCNNTISVQAWNTSYVKNITVQSRNGSAGDVVSFNISNVTGYQVQELKVNGTSINAYQAGANGMLNFSYTVVENKTLTLSPAMNSNGYNMTWLWMKNYIQGTTEIKTQYDSAGVVRNTVYYNSNATSIFVNMRANCDTGRGMRARSDTSNPPMTTVASYNSAGTGADNSLAFFVLPGNYYMMSETGVACTDTNSTIWR